MKRDTEFLLSVLNSNCHEIIVNSVLRNNVKTIIVREAFLLITLWSILIGGIRYVKNNSRNLNCSNRVQKN